MSRTEKCNEVRGFVTGLGFSITAEDTQRPWGCFFVIEESQSEEFINRFFPGEKIPEGRVSPKILMVEPGKKLSWQYHHRRSERWRMIDGTASVVISENDKEGPARTFEKGEELIIGRGERHRLIGLDTWGVVAEIWVHSDPSNPSNEDDIVRLSDDFGR